MKESEHSPAKGRADWTIKTARDHSELGDSPPSMCTKTQPLSSQPKSASQLRYPTTSGNELYQDKKMEGDELVPWCSTKRIPTDIHGSPEINHSNYRERAKNPLNREHPAESVPGKMIPPELECEEKGTALKTSVLTGGWTSTNDLSGTASPIQKYDRNQLSRQHPHQKEVLYIHMNILNISEVTWLQESAFILIFISRVHIIST